MVPLYLYSISEVRSYLNNMMTLCTIQKDFPEKDIPSKETTYAKA